MAFACNFPVLVNTTSTGEQNRQDIAGIATSYVIVWESAGQDGSGEGIYSQRLSSTGTALSVETLVNTTTAGDQSSPKVAGFANGSFVVTWLAADGDSVGIYMQRFNGANTKLGAETLVNITTAGPQAQHSITALADGGYAVSWVAQAGIFPAITPTLLTRIYDASGIAVTGEIQVGVLPDMAWGDTRTIQLDNGGTDGDLIMGWHSGPGTEAALTFQRMTSTGALVGGQVTVGQSTGVHRSAFQMAALPDGGFIMTWQQRPAGINDDPGHLAGRIFDADGDARGSEFFITQPGAPNQQLGDVEVLADGRIFITYNEIRAIVGDTVSTSASVVMVRQINETGQTVGDPIEVSIHDTDYSLNPTPRLQVLVNGDLIVTWTDASASGGSNPQIVTRRIHTDSDQPATEAGNTINLNNTGQTVDGLGGGDTIVGGTGADRIFGNTGNDDLKGGGGHDWLGGGDGDDEISGENGNDQIEGHDGDDTLLGGGGDDHIIGGPGNDIIDGGANQDLLIGGSGDDTISGGDHDDIIHGDYDVPHLIHGDPAGNDILSGGGGNDTIFGGGGDDVIDGGAGDDTLRGDTPLGEPFAPGNDRFILSTGIDVISGGSGVDIIDGSAMATGLTITLAGDATGTATTLAVSTTFTSIEHAIGSALNDMINGSAFADILDGGGGNDTMTGGDGSDTYFLDSLSDVVIEASGSAAGTADVVNFLGTAGQTYLLAANVENLNLLGSAAANATGNELGNVINGNAQSNLLNGGDGADTINGGIGGDYIFGGLGNDVMDGGADFDTVSWFDSVGGVLVNLTNQAQNAGGAAGDTLANFENYYLTGSTDVFTNNGNGGYIYGFGGADTITGGAGVEIIDGGAGADTIDAGGGFDYVSWNSSGGVVVNLSNPAANTGDAAGDTVVNAEAFFLSEFNDIFVGQNSSNIVYGFGGDDMLSDGTGSNAWLFGGDGNDTLYGGSLNDLLSGEGGSDTYVYRNWIGEGFDSILNFTSGQDRFQISGFGIAAGFTLSASTFVAAPSPFATTTLATFLYSTTFGILYFDPDGSNSAIAPVALAQIAGAPLVAATDFVFI